MDFSTLVIEASTWKDTIPRLWLLLEDSLALHCTLPASHHVHQMQSAGLTEILWPPCHRDTQSVVCGLGHHRSWVKTLILCAAKLGRRAWLYDYSNSDFALLSPTGERRMQICQLWSRLSEGLPRASRVCGHFAPFHYTTGENQAYCMCATKSAHTHS